MSIDDMIILYQQRNNVVVSVDTKWTNTFEFLARTYLSLKDPNNGSKFVRELKESLTTEFIKLG